MSKRPRTEESANGGSQADVARRGLVSLNQLDYVLQPDLSVCVARTMKRHFFQQNNYLPSQRAIIILNSGADYVDAANSYLNFTVTNLSSVQPVYLGIGSGLNFIKRLLLTTRSGDELERIDELGQLAVRLDRYMHSKEWRQTHGAMVGYNDSPEGESLPADGVRTFVIPLPCLCGMFKSFNRLLPSMLTSGLRIEIEWEKASLAVKNGLTNESNTIAPEWEINNPEISLDSYQLTDSIQRVMNEEAAMRGLEMVFSSWYHHTSTQKGGNTTDANIEVRKAVSRALGVLSHIRPIGREAAKYTADFYKSKPYLNTSYQLRLGSLYFPLQPITNRLAAPNGSLYEAYHHTQRGFGKIKTPSAPTGVVPLSQRRETVVVDYGYPADDTIQLTVKQFAVTKTATDLPVLKSSELVGKYIVVPSENVRAKILSVSTTNNASTVFELYNQAATIAAPSTVAWYIEEDIIPTVEENYSFDDGLACFYTDLERSSTQRLTGVPVNNSRVAEVQIKDDYTTSADWTGYLTEIWLHYVRLARVFLQNVEIEE